MLSDTFIQEPDHVVHQDSKVVVTKIIFIILCVFKVIGLVIIGYTVWLYMSYKKAECETNIKTYLLLTSINAFINNVYSLVKWVMRDSKKISDEWPQVLINLSRFIVFIYGSIVVFRINYNSHICPDPMYMFALVIQLVVYYLLLIIIVSSICMILTG